MAVRDRPVPGCLMGATIAASGRSRRLLTQDDAVAEETLTPYGLVADDGISPHGERLAGGEARLRLPGQQRDAQHDTHCGPPGRWWCPNRDARREVLAVARVDDALGNRSVQMTPHGVLTRRRIERE